MEKIKPRDTGIDEVKVCRQAKRLKESIRRSQQGTDTIGEIHSEAGSDGAWELLHQEVSGWHVTSV